MEEEEEEEEEEEYDDNCAWGEAPPSRWDGAMFPLVVTLPYRAPELIVTTRSHSIGIDKWALGATIAEAVRAAALLVFHGIGSSSSSSSSSSKRTPLFGDFGDSELAVYARIATILGPPSTRVWPKGSTLPRYMGASVYCTSCGDGVTPTASTSTTVVSHPLPTWLLTETQKDSCTNSGSGGGGGGNAAPIFHVSAMLALSSWLCGGEVGDAPPAVLPESLARLPQWVDLILRLCAWDADRRLELSEVTKHVSLVGAPTGAAALTLVRTLCRSLQPEEVRRPSLSSPSSSQPLAAVGDEEVGGGGVKKRSVGLFLSFNGLDDDD